MKCLHSRESIDLEIDPESIKAHFVTTTSHQVQLFVKIILDWPGHLPCHKKMKKVGNRTFGIPVIIAYYKCSREIKWNCKTFSMGKCRLTRYYCSLIYY